MSNTASTAILFFSRTAEQEAAFKTFHPSLDQKANTAIGHALIQSTQKTLAKTGLPVYNFDHHSQLGTGFGERLANSVEKVFNLGYTNLIVVGNDCPSLSSSLIKKVNQQLDHDDLVLGPSTDGGVYLIGLNKKVYHRATFIELPWQDSTLQNGWKQYAQKELIQIKWLATQKDVDNANDLKFILNSFKNFQALKKQLLKIINILSTVLIRKNYKIHSFEFHNTLLLRGPPLCPLIG